MTQAETVECVRRARCGENQAIEEIYLQLRLRLPPRLKSSLPPELDMEDILSDAMLILWRTLDRLRDEQKVFVYAERIAQNLVSRRQREGRRFTPLLDEPGVSSPDLSWRNLEGEEWFAELLGALRSGERELFRLLYTSETGDEEARTRLGLSDRLFRLRKHRLRLKLQGIVGRLKKG